MPKPFIPTQVLGYAFVVVSKLVLHIAKVVVDAGHRRNGIGSRLIKVPDIISLCTFRSDTA